MLNWLFGTTPSQSQSKPQTTTKSQVDNSWALQYLGQYLNSPLWRTPVINFIQNNCTLFQDTEQNPFQYTVIFKNFTTLISGLIDGVMKEVGISEQLMEECIVKGLKTKKRRLFEQLLVCDNFLAFKKVMVKKNKEFEMEALKQLSKQDSTLKVDEKKYKMDLQRIQIEKAIAMSQALSSKIDQEEEKMIQQAIRESEREQEKRIAKLIKESEKPDYSKLPKLNLSKPAAFGSSLLDQKPLDELFKNRENIIEQTKKIESTKVSVEDAQERKKRFKEQRELIKQKNQDKRKEELMQFLAGKQEEIPKEEVHVVEEQKISEEELMRRKNLAKKLKGQLGL